MVTEDAGGDRPTAVVVCVHIIIDAIPVPDKPYSFVNLTFLLFLVMKRKSPILVVMKVPSGYGRCWWPYCLQL